MSMTLDELKTILDQEGLKYFVDPKRPVVMLGARGLFGSFHCVIRLDNDGQFLQFRTVSYMYCPADHPNIAAVLRLLASLNYRLRMVKFGWDPSDGEIVVYADCWLVDSGITRQQFSRMMTSYLPTLDIFSDRIRKVIDTGDDPGDPGPDALMAALLGGQSLPPELRELLARLRSDDDSDSSADDDDDDDVSRP